MPGEIAAALIGSAISAGAGLLGTNMRNEAQKRESQLAYARAMAQQKEMNAYNSASAQMARLQAAGLNPNLMYEQGQSAAAGTQETMPEYQPADIQSPTEPIGNLGSQMVNSLIGLKDLQNKTAATESEIALNETLAGVNISQIKLNDGTLDIMYQTLGLDKQKVEQELKESESRIRVNDKNYELLGKQAEDILQRIEESKERIKKIKAETGLVETQDIVAAALLPSQIELNQMNAYQAMQMGWKAYEEARHVMYYYDLDVEKFEFQKRSFQETLDFQEAQNKRDRILGYSNLGMQGLSLVANIATKGAGSLGMFASSPLGKGMNYGIGRVLHGTANKNPNNYFNRKK